MTGSGRERRGQGCPARAVIYQCIFTCPHRDIPHALIPSHLHFRRPLNITDRPIASVSSSKVLHIENAACIQHLASNEFCTVRTFPTVGCCHSRFSCNKIRSGRTLERCGGDVHCPFRGVKRWGAQTGRVNRCPRVDPRPVPYDLTSLASAPSLLSNPSGVSHPCVSVIQALRKQRCASELEWPGSLHPHYRSHWSDFPSPVPWSYRFYSACSSVCTPSPLRRAYAKVIPSMSSGQ